MASNQTARSYAQERAVALAVMVGAGLLLYFHLYEYAVGFVDGAYELSLFSDNPIAVAQRLLLVITSFASFSFIISSFMQLLFPSLSLSDDFFDELIDETLLGGILIIGLVGPLIEELKYRLLPYITISVIFFLFGNVGIWHGLAVVIVVVDTAKWVMAHGLRTPAIAPFGVFYRLRRASASRA